MGRFIAFLLVGLLTAIISILASILANLLNGKEPNQWVSQATIFIILLLVAVISFERLLSYLIIQKGALNPGDEQSHTGKGHSSWRIIYRGTLRMWGNVVYLLGWVATGSILVYAILNKWYERIDTNSDWSLAAGCIFFIAAIVPAGQAISYRAKINVLLNWPLWRSRIARYMNNRDAIHESEVQQIMADASYSEVHVAMKLFATDVNAKLKKDDKGKYVLTRM